MEHVLRAYRRKKGLTAADLGRLLGFAASTIRSFENGHREIQADHAVTIEEKTGIDRALLRPDLWKRAA